MNTTVHWLYSSFSTYSQHITQQIITSMKFSLEFLYSFGPNHTRKIEIFVFSRYFNIWLICNAPMV